MTEREIIDWTLRKSGLPEADRFDEGGRWLDMALPWATMHFLDGFGHADKRFHFEADWVALGPYAEGLPSLPDHVDIIDKADAERPFRMVVPPARSFLNSTFNNTPGSLGREGRPSARLHPDDLAALGLGAGDRVRLGNARGSVVVHAKSSAGQLRGVVIVEGIWPNRAFEEGIGINALTSAEPGRPKGGAAFHDTAVWVRPA
jgi:anaerobic selenocysteine-containing dehydrogenase